eukprot:756671-Karenia_brevis.AAC.1
MAMVMKTMMMMIYQRGGLRYNALPRRGQGAGAGAGAGELQRPQDNQIWTTRGSERRRTPI